MHDALNAGGGAGLEQRTRRFSVDAARVVARGLLQHAYAIHDALDAGKSRQPLGDLDVLVEVASDPVDVRHDAAAERKIAPRADDLHAAPLKRRDHFTADKNRKPP